ncbi:MAG TPA: chemotaxis protein CheW [Ramlibacter sp.]|uniref:chemotaxis protein CheW n=1 Tax=Ramlibacter sp. TaxID=1917967 RepID=UPI002CD151E7|nr:chemotaxis protein CheW [Ramlibacter sp.]HVZ43475.1 chemotaxis protein CheW [Ramlibacter sp.]
MTTVHRFVRLTLDGMGIAVALAPVERVIRAVAVTPLPGGPAPILGVIDFHGHVVPVADLRRRLGLPPREVLGSDHFVVVRTPRRLIALVADSADDVLLVSAAELVETDSIVSGVDRLPGIARTPDGLVLIHDVEQFLDATEEAALQQALANG